MWRSQRHQTGLQVFNPHSMKVMCIFVGFDSLFGTVSRLHGMVRENKSAPRNEKHTEVGHGGMTRALREKKVHK